MDNNESAKTLMLVVMVLVLVSAALYWAVGGDSEFDRSTVASADGAATQLRTPESKAASVSSLVSGLESRLAENPDDAKGWLLLARSHDHLGNSNAAWSAYGRARELGMSDESFELKLAARMP